MIQLENVHKSYGQTKVLKGIDLQIQDQDDVWLSWVLLDQESPLS